MELLRERDHRPADEAAYGNRLIEEYATRTAEAASSDREMAERLRWEIMDHLAEAALEAEDAQDPARAAIERFGSPVAFVAEYRTAVVGWRLKRMRSTALYAMIAVFVGMRLRNFFLEPGWRDSLQSTFWGDALLAIDRYAFLIAVLLLTVGLISGSRFFPRIRMGDGPKSDLVTIAAPSVLILLSALAIIGSIFVLTGPSVMSLANYGLGSVTFAALATVCIVILARLLNLVVAYVTSLKTLSLPKELF
ncbi:hypothetical protein [Falsirhodobacter xinxiangensis]|uniref:hypothetical protein n=1 Tax=Falsirhodobacter xinxiangensis TaxID=2530049 RepID=UPI0010A9E4D2|nr:hypothetical protein [Rhodobacter xinxiangensis]